MFAAHAALQRLWDGELTIHADSDRVARRCVETPTDVAPPPVPEPETLKAKPVRVSKPSRPPPPRTGPNVVSFGSSSSALVALPRRTIQKHTIRREETLPTLSDRRDERASYSSAISQACAAYKCLL